MARQDQVKVQDFITAAIAGHKKTVQRLLEKDPGIVNATDVIDIHIKKQDKNKVNG